MFCNFIRNQRKFGNHSSSHIHVMADIETKRHFVNNTKMGRISMLQNLQ